MEEFFTGAKKVKKLTPEEVVFFHRCERMIASALTCSKGETSRPGILCCDITGDSLCTSVLDVMIIDVPNEIRWTCPVCGEKGKISNWRKSPVFTSSAKPVKTEGRYLLTLLTIPSECYSTLIESCKSYPQLRFLISMAVDDGDTCSFHISTQDRLELLNAVSLKALKDDDRNLEILKDIIAESVRD